MEKRAAAASLKRGGFVDGARRAATQHVAVCVGLSRENLGDEPYRFERELRARVARCDGNGGLHEIEPIRDEETKTLTGYRSPFARLAMPSFSVPVRNEPLTL